MTPFNLLTLLHLTSGIPRYAQNAYFQVKVMAFNGLPYADII